MGIFYGGYAHGHVKRIAARLGGRVAADFYGITIGGWNVLFRQGYPYFQVTRGHKYARWNWKTPFGRPADWRAVDYVLLCGPEIGEARETFFLFRVKDAAALGRAWPDQLNIGTDPRVMRGQRDKIWKHRVTLTELRRRLAD